MDGAHLGLDVWPAEEPRAVIVAVHGMNDYANAFAMAGQWWAKNAHITTYAYDQRGFGRSPNFGRWPGEGALKADLRAALKAARAAHPDLPLFVLGHSMGAAVAMTAEAEAPLDADAVILASPGVWGGRQMSPFYRLTLNLAATLAPGKTLTGARAQRQSTDNIPVLKAMLADPHVIKPTRLDAVLGVVRLMGDAYAEAGDVEGDILFLYGEKDEIIPLKAIKKTARRISGDVEVRSYENGWHLLFRDLQAETVWRDVAAWVEARAAGTGGEASVAAPGGDGQTRSSIADE
ncbi:MAG: alpha/beta fold hydrolase [Parvularculaceae bacterium]